MEKTNFQNLVIYKLSGDLADSVWNIVNGWTALARDTVGKQIIRACDSVGAKIAEGNGKGAPTDNRRFLRMARGSLYETKHWLRRAYQRRLLAPEQTELLVPLMVELVKKLNAYIGSVSRTIKTQQSGINKS